AKAETHPSVAVSPTTGDIDVAYQLAFSPTDDDILMSRFSAAGQSLGTVGVATSTAREQAPSVSMDFAGQAVVAYQKVVGNNFDIKARRVSAAGAVGSEINVASSADDEINPSVALRREGDQFVVGYQRLDPPPILESASNAPAAPSVRLGETTPSPDLT